MLFNSTMYLGFVAAVTFIFFVSPFRIRRFILLAVSLLFYMKWSAPLVLLLFYVILLNYFCTLSIARSNNVSVRKWVATAGVAGNLAPLLLFKYLDFFIRSAAWIVGSSNWTELHLILPIGISFYTFQGLSYTIDVYRGKLEANRSLLDVALYLSFFPLVLAGPIMRAPVLMPQLRRETKPDLNRLTEAGLIIAGGLIKKVIFAELLADYVNQVYARPADFSGTSLLIASYSYTLQIYCDFSGYTDIAIGSAKLLGIDLMKNFDTPYLAVSFQDFWRRWHIALSSWLRDYLYISLGGNKKGRYRTYLNLIITMLLGGLWHGANYTFIIWGGMHGICLAVERLFRERRKNEAGPEGPIGIWLRRLLVFNVVNILWIFFRAPSLNDALSVITGILTWSSGKNIGYYPLALILVFMTYEIINQSHSAFGWLTRRPMLSRWAIYIIVLIMLMIFAGAPGQNFIYFKF